jgi:putative spermidine/putrescine transport system ATP-binding protein
MVSLSEFGNRMPAQLSGGQQQRVAVARALVFDPAVVLMDEPLGALDKNLRESMQYELKSIHEKLGVTVVYVTHDQGEALTMSNRIAVFNDGNVQQLSSPSELYESPVNSFVAQFIGENNTFTGTVKKINGNKVSVQTDSGEVIQANPIAVSNVGEKTTVSLRPERVIINPDSNVENQFECNVQEIIYHGDHTRLRVSILNNTDFILKIPNAEKKSNISTDDKIKLGWSSVDCRALD